MSKNWKIREQTADNLEEQLLLARGIKDKEKFFNPDYERDLRDPFKILNMDKAAGRILQAIKKNEKVVLYGDYDADGVCASAIFHDFFKKVGFENFEVYIPDRNVEGYGLNFEAIKEIVENKVDLVITLDCGITDYDEVRKLNEAGLDTVILDHHLESGKLPKAIAIVDTKQEKDKYPFKSLAGAGVAFKTVQAIVDKGDFNIVPGWEKWLLDLVAIATVADMVSLTDENRVLTYYGLKVLRKNNRVGLLSLFSKFNVNQETINEDDVAFTIAPRINIAGRMDHANTSFALLTTESESEADWISGHLNGLNGERREVVEKILNQIDAVIGQKVEKPEIIIEGDSSWKAGVLGLTANRIVEKYNCPVFLWGEKGKGSARSNGVNLVELMAGLPEGILLESGGHAPSAGFSVAEDKINDFKKELEKAFKKIDKEKIEDILWIDKELKIEEVVWDLLEVLERFSPFGIGNEKPVFLFKDLEVYSVKMFGNGGIHLQLNFRGKDGLIPAIGFFMENKEPEIKKGSVVDLVASVEKNNFRGHDELRLRIIDIRLK